MINKIRKIAEDVFSALGSGYSEEIYEKAMEVGLRLARIPYENQRNLPIFYKNFAVGVSRPDLIIKDVNGGEKIVLELKATSSSVGMKEEVQLQKYLHTLKMKKGLLINFPQTNKDGPGVKIDFIEVSDELNKCENCKKIICHNSNCESCAKEEDRKTKKFRKTKKVVKKK